MNRLAACAAAVAVSACASPASLKPAAADPVVYPGVQGPQYATHAELKAQHRRDSEERMWAAVRFQKEAEAVLQLVQADPRFGGFIFRHEPAPHAVVMFTGDASARLRRYTRDPRFHAQSVQLTLAELERMKDETTPQLIRLGVRCITVDGDEEHNRVTVRTPEVEKVRRAIAEGRFKPPRKFALLPGLCAELR